MKELKADLKTFFKIALLIIVAIGSIQLYKYNSSDYESAFELDDNEGVDGNSFTEEFSTEKGDSLIEDNNIPPGVELSIKDSYIYRKDTNYYSEIMQNGIVLENTGDVPILVDEIDLRLESEYGDSENSIEVEEFEVILFDEVPERPIYPGEEFNYNAEALLQENEFHKSRKNLDIENISDVEVVYEIDFYVQEKDVENVEKGKKIKENPYEITYEQENVVLDEEGDETIVTGELNLQTSLKEIEGVYDFPVSLKFYDEKGDLHYIEKAYLPVIDEGVNIEDIEFESIPAPLIFDTPVEDLNLKIHVSNG